MTNMELEAYVRAALAAQGYRMGEEEVARVLMQFSRLATIAEAMLAVPLDVRDEPAPDFLP